MIFSPLCGKPLGSLIRTQIPCLALYMATVPQHWLCWEQLTCSSGASSSHTAPLPPQLQSALAPPAPCSSQAVWARIQVLAQHHKFSSAAVLGVSRTWDSLLSPQPLSTCGKIYMLLSYVPVTYFSILLLTMLLQPTALRSLRGIQIWKVFP